MLTYQGMSLFIVYWLMDFTLLTAGQAAAFGRQHMPHTLHTCQPSRSRRDSPVLETEARHPARLPKRADSSRFVPINAQNTILNLPFACSLCSSVGIQVSSVSFDQFSCTRPWRAVIQTKNLYILGRCSGKKFILLPFSSERKKLCIYFRPIFLAVNV